MQYVVCINDKNINLFLGKHPKVAYTFRMITETSVVKEVGLFRQRETLIRQVKKYYFKLQKYYEHQHSTHQSNNM